MIERLTRWIVPAVGGLVLALALAIVFAGDAVAVGLEPLAALGADTVVLAVAGLAGVLTLGIHLRRSVGGDSRPTSDVRAGEASVFSPRDRSLDRWTITEPVDASVSPPELGETTYQRTARGKARRSARVRAQRLAIETLASVEGHAYADAADRVRDGAWADDPRAAAFVGSGQTLPLRIRFVDWLTGAGYRRGLEATLAELERLDATGSNRPGATDTAQSEAADTAQPDATDAIEHEEPPIPEVRA